MQELNITDISEPILLKWYPFVFIIKSTFQVSRCAITLQNDSFWKKYCTYAIFCPKGTLWIVKVWNFCLKSHKCDNWQYLVAACLGARWWNIIIKFYFFALTPLWSVDLLKHNFGQKIYGVEKSFMQIASLFTAHTFQSLL